MRSLKLLKTVKKIDENKLKAIEKYYQVKWGLVSQVELLDEFDGTQLAESNSWTRMRA